jgi:hypothetical protein
VVYSANPLPLLLVPSTLTESGAPGNTDLVSDLVYRPCVRPQVDLRISAVRRCPRGGPAQGTTLPLEDGVVRPAIGGFTFGGCVAVDTEVSMQAERSMASRSADGLLQSGTFAGERQRPAVGHGPGARWPRPARTWLLVAHSRWDGGCWRRVCAIRCVGSRRERGVGRRILTLSGIANDIHAATRHALAASPTALR